MKYSRCLQSYPAHRRGDDKHGGMNECWLLGLVGNPFPRGRGVIACKGKEEREGIYGEMSFDVRNIWRAVRMNMAVR